MVALRARVNDPRRERGAAALEFALVVPILCFLLFGIISYGYMLSFRQAISQAAAEGARSAAVAPSGLPNTCDPDDDCRETRAIAAINQGLGSYGVTCDGTNLMHGDDPAGTCTISEPTECAGSTSNAMCVAVTLNYTYEDDSLLPSFPGLGILLPSNLSYTTEAEAS